MSLVAVKSKVQVEYYKSLLGMAKTLLVVEPLYYYVSVLAGVPIYLLDKHSVVRVSPTGEPVHKHVVNSFRVRVNRRLVFLGEALGSPVSEVATSTGRRLAFPKTSKWAKSNEEYFEG